MALLPTAPAIAQQATENAVMMDTGTGQQLPSEIIWPRENRVMVLIPGGTYTIGIDNPRERGFPSAEGPAVEVTVGPFYIDKFEVTYDEYMSIAGAHGLGVPRLNIDDEAAVQGDLPIRAVSFDDATGYAEAVRKSLPTEAEWEVAFRGENSLLYPWGNEPREDAAVVGLGTAGSPAPVGTTTQDKSPFGVMDMAGNVSEWTGDHYDRNYYQTASGQKNPQAEAKSESRTIRGGNYYSVGGTHATNRTGGIPTSTREDVGFRTVFRLVPPPPATPTPTPAPPTPTPGPTIEEQLGQLLERAQPYFENPSLDVPSELQGREEGTSQVPVANLTAYSVVAGFVNVAESKIYGFPTMIEPMAVQNMRLPSETASELIILGQDAPRNDLINAGPVNPVTEPLIMLRNNTFNPVFISTGRVITTSDNVTAQQVYPQGMAPRYTEFDIFNATEYPIEVTVRAAGVEEMPVQIIDPQTTARIVGLPQTEVTVRGQYINASGSGQPTPVTFTNNDQASARLVRFAPSSASGQTVRVGTRQMPVLIPTLQEFELPPAVRSKYSSRSR